MKFATASNAGSQASEQRGPTCWHTALMVPTDIASAQRPATGSDIAPTLAAPPAVVAPPNARAYHPAHGTPPECRERAPT